MSSWPKHLPPIDMDTPRSFAATGDGLTIRLQKDVEGLNQTVSYSLHAGGRKLKQPYRKFQMPLAEAVDRFVRIYRKHFQPEATPK